MAAPATRARSADAGPEIVLDEAFVVGLVAHFSLAPDAEGGGVERLLPDFLAHRIVEFRHEAASRGTGFRLRFADDDMDAVAKAQQPAMQGGALSHVVQHRADVFDPVRPHQEDIRGLCRDIARVIRQAAEIKRWQAVMRLNDARRIELQIVELALVRKVMAGEKRAQDFHDFQGTRITRRAVERLARQFRRDDVDGQAAMQHVIERCELARELGRPHFTAADRDEKLHPLQERRDGAREGDAVDAERIAGRQENIVETTLLRAHDNVAAMIE